MSRSHAETYKTLYVRHCSPSRGIVLGVLEFEAFARTLSEAVTSGTEAREKLEGVFSDWISFMNLPSSKEWRKPTRPSGQCRRESVRSKSRWKTLVGSKANCHAKREALLHKYCLAFSAGGTGSESGERISESSGTGILPVGRRDACPTKRVPRS